jgi:hypothetical protein
MAETVFACDRVPTGKTCSVQIVGERDHVIAAAKDHLSSTHGRAGEANLHENVSNAVDEKDAPTPYATWV